MSAQKTYSYKTGYGVAGGLVDLTEHVIDTRNNESAGLKFGMGVVEGTTKGAQVKLPVKADTKAMFEGVVVNSHTHEMDRDGEVVLAKGESVGVLKEGRVFVRIAASVTPAYGEAVYLITDGDNVGLFTNVEAAGTTVKLKGYFLDGATGGVAPVQLTVDKVNDPVEK